MKKDRASNNTTVSVSIYSHQNHRSESNNDTKEADDPSNSETSTLQLEHPSSSSTLRMSPGKSGKMKLYDQKSRNKKLVKDKLSELTINKLKIQNIGLVGREQEVELLSKRLHIMMESAKPKDDEFDSTLSDSIIGPSMKRLPSSKMVMGASTRNTQVGGTKTSRSLTNGSLPRRAAAPSTSTARGSASTRGSGPSLRPATRGSDSTRGSALVPGSRTGGVVSLRSSGRAFSGIKKELVFIKGFSGVGKTSLARALRPETKNGFFVEGKFDLNSKDEPYAGIAKAFGELIRELKRTDLNKILGIGDKLREMLGKDVEPLQFLIPELEEVVPKLVLDKSFKARDSSSAMDGMQERWKYSFRVLARLLTEKIKPLVVVIDDLQWADKASLDLMESLISDIQNANPLMIIGCYRSNEVDETSDLSKKMSILQEKSAGYGFEITEIAVESCQMDDVNHMIMKMMDTDDEKYTKDLAEVCFHRTLGNPFFVINFMSMLQREELVKFNIGTMKWTFDVPQIEHATMSTANVVEMLQSRMQKMPSDIQLFLAVAACLGPSFRTSILELVWRNLSFVETKGFEQDKVPSLVEYCETEMLIEADNSDSKYRWVHDKVQEAALSLAEMDKSALKFEMGKILYMKLEGKALDDELFDVADLLCCGKNEPSVDFANLCLKAAKKAKQLSAFLAALKYIQHGIGMLPADMWSKHRSLTLEFFTLGAQLQLALGNSEGAKEYCSAVLERDDIEMTDKIPLRVAETKRLATVEMRYADAIQACLALLKDLGFDYCWSKKLVPPQALIMLYQTTKVIARLPKDFHLQLRRMDKHNRVICELLMRISYASKYIEDIMGGILCYCHMAQLTLQHGLCEYSAPAFSLIGSLAILVFKKHQYAPTFRDAALSTQSHFGSTLAPLTGYTTYTYNLGWTLRLENIAEPLFESYIQGMQNGEVEMAMHCLNSYCVHLPYALGKSINQMLDECPGVLMQMQELSQMSQAKMVKMFHQMCFNLHTPRQENPTVLDGEIYNIEVCAGNKLLVAWHGFVECQLLLFFDDPSAADRALKSTIKTVSPGYILRMTETFHRGVCLYVAARRTKSRKYKQKAKKMRKVLRKWNKVGNPNVAYYCIFLDAEHAALKGKYEEAENHYLKAIQFAARSGYLHHAALFNELYSDFLLRHRGDREEAKYRLEQAIRYYEDWGAFGKVELLCESNLLK